MKKPISKCKVGDIISSNGLTMRIDDIGPSSASSFPTGSVIKVSRLNDDDEWEAEDDDRLYISDKNEVRWLGHDEK
jgi:hypothetical protein